MSFPPLDCMKRATTTHEVGQLHEQWSAQLPLPLAVPLPLPPHIGAPVRTAAGHRMSVGGHIGAPVRTAAGHRMCPKYAPPLLD